MKQKLFNNHFKLQSSMNSKGPSNITKKWFKNCISHSVQCQPHVNANNSGHSLLTHTMHRNLISAVDVLTENERCNAVNDTF